MPLETAATSGVFRVVTKSRGRATIKTGTKPKQPAKFDQKRKKPENGSVQMTCRHCRLQGHLPDKYGARNSQCHDCSKIGHYSRICKMAPRVSAI